MMQNNYTKIPGGGGLAAVVPRGGGDATLAAVTASKSPDKTAIKNSSLCTVIETAAAG